MTFSGVNGDAAISRWERVFYEKNNYQSKEETADHTYEIEYPFPS